MGLFYGGPISELELVQFHLGVNIKYSQALSRDEHLSSQVTCMCKTLPSKSHVVDILFSSRAAPGQNVRIPRARAAAVQWWHSYYATAGLHSHSCSPARSSGDSLGRRDSKTHLPSHTIYCGQQNVSEEDFLFSFLSKWPLQAKSNQD